MGRAVNLPGHRPGLGTPALGADQPEPVFLKLKRVLGEWAQRPAGRASQKEVDAVLVWAGFSEVT